MGHLAQVRVEEAKRLLSSSRLKVYEVGERVGYPNVEHFSRVFKKLTCLSPSAWPRGSEGSIGYPGTVRLRKARFVGEFVKLPEYASFTPPAPHGILPPSSIIRRVARGTVQGRRNHVKEDR